MKRNRLQAAIIIFTIIVMILIIYLVFTDRLMTQDEATKALDKALIEKL